jgi:hypothetical protein|tara:strand:+ start:387 stop:584 length:198 start_codon:yes stop_codon:yes gene_type:complete
MAKRNALKQEYYKTSVNSYWKDNEGKPTIEYVNWLEDKINKNNSTPNDEVTISINALTNPDWRTC